MPGSILGTAVRRVEDPALLTGEASFVDDLPLDSALELVFVRSPIAHARIRDIDIEAAVAMPGVVAVYTARNLELPPYEGLMVVNDKCVRMPLAAEKVRFVGDTVAAVVAHTRQEALDGAEAVVVEYDELPAVIDPEAALLPDAPLQFEELGTNRAAGTRPRPADDPLAGAEVVVRGRFENQRIAVLPMEGNAIAVVPGSESDDYDVTVYVSTQMPHGTATRASSAFEL